MGRADTGDLEIDLVELFADAASVATDLSVGIALFIDEMQDVPAPDVSALCAACHELSQTGAPLIVVGAGLPHLPSVLSASKSYSERLFHYLRIDRLERDAADRALIAPAAAGGRGLHAGRARRPLRRVGRVSYFVQAYGKVTWDAAPASPITAEDVKVAAPNADAELAVGFFGSRYERATPAERGLHARRWRRSATGRSPPPRSPTPWAASRPPSRRPETLCSRRASSTPPNAASSPSPFPTSANSSAPNTRKRVTPTHAEWAMLWDMRVPYPPRRRASSLSWTRPSVSGSAVHTSDERCGGCSTRTGAGWRCAPHSGRSKTVGTSGTTTRPVGRQQRSDERRAG